MLTFPPVPLVNYADIRAQICSGDILLCSGTAIFSKLIQQVTKSVFSHVAFVLREDSIDRIMVLESVESIGVQTVPLSQYMSNYNHSGAPYKGRLFIARHGQVKSQTTEALKHFSQGAVDLFGTKYDNHQIASIAMRIGAAKLWFTLGEPYKNTTFICSEYCWHCFNSIGIDIPYDIRGFISPADFIKCPEIQLLWEIATEGHGS
jgi:hypothetical protein